MRLHRSRSDIQLLDMLGADMDDVVDVLENAFNQQELRIRHQRTVCLVQIGVDDCVRDTGLIFD
jgi:hypothetical protein